MARFAGIDDIEIRRCGTSHSIIRVIVFAAAACLLISFPAALTSDELDIGPDEDPVMYAMRVIGILDRLSALYQEAHKSGNLEKAIRYFEKTLEIERKVLGENHTEVAGSLLNLADMHAELGQSGEARELLHKALAIIEQQPFSLWHEAKIRFYLDDFDRRQQMTSEEKILLEECRNIDRLREVLEAKKKWEQAIPLAEETLRIKRHLLGDNRPDYAMDLLKLGVLFWKVGDFTRTESLLEKSLEVTRRTLGEHHLRYAWGLFCLGDLYYCMKDYDRAEPLMVKAFDLYLQTGGKDDNNYMRIASRLGDLYARKGEYLKAFGYERVSSSSKAAKVTQKDLMASILSRLADSFCRQGAPARAEESMKKALRAGEEAFGRDNPHYAHLQQKIAHIYCEMRALERAEPYLLQSLEVFRRHLKRASLFQSERQQLFLVDRTRGSLDSYLSYASAAAVPGGEIYGLVLPWKGSVFLHQRHMRLMRKYPDLKPLFEEYRTVSIQLGDSTFKDVEPGNHDTWKKGTRELFQRREQLERELFSKMSRSRSLDPEENHGVEMRAAWIDFESIFFAVPDPSRSGSEVRADMNDAIREIKDIQDEISRKLADRSAAYRKAAATLLQDPGGKPTGLPPEAVLVDFLEYSRTLYGRSSPGKEIPQVRHLAAFVLRNEKPVAFVDLGPVEPIRSAIESWRGKVCGHDQKATSKSEQKSTGGGSPPDIDWTRDRTVKRLRQLLWEPLVERTAGARLVLISPDGCLGLFPFAALPGTLPGTFLIEETAVVHIPTPQLLPGIAAAEPAADAGSPPSLFLVGGVDFDADLPEPDRTLAGRVAKRGGLEEWKKFNALDGSDKEIVRVKDLFGRSFLNGTVTAFRGKAASEETFREEVENHGFIHLATHGFFAPPELKSVLSPVRDGSSALSTRDSSMSLPGYHPGLLSGIVFAGANRKQPHGRDDGIFTAMEMATYDLSKVELMVLSACETGLGVSAGGEGHIGLLRAAQLAGARTVVASLWKVDDRATQELMGRFYENLWSDGLSKLEALRRVQLESIARKAPPKEWAAWIISGDWR